MSVQEFGSSLPSTRCLEESLAAIRHTLQDILNREDAPRGEARGNPAAGGSASADAVDSRLRPARQPRRHDQDRFYGTPTRSPDQPAACPAANSSRRLVGRLLQSLQEQPSRTSYVVSFLFACMWTQLSAFIAWNYFSSTNLGAMFGQGGLATAQLLGLGAAVLGASIFLFVLAHLVARAHALTDALVHHTGQLAINAEDIKRALGSHATEIANSLDTRIACLHELVDRIETASSRLEERASEVASALITRTDQLSQAITAAAGEPERSITTLATSTPEVIPGSAQDAQQSLVLLASSTSDAICTGANAAKQSLQALAASTTEAIRSSVRDAKRTLASLGTSCAELINAGAQDAKRSLKALVASAAEAIRVDKGDAK
jgi:hypothetical protein